MFFKYPEIEICSDDAVINIIRSEVKGWTKRFDFFIVEKCDSFERTDKERDAPGIQWVHSLVVWIAFRNLDAPMKISSEKQEEHLKKVTMLMIFMTTMMTNNWMHTTAKKAKTRSK